MVALKTGRKNKDVLLCGSRTNYEQVSTVTRETGRERGNLIYYSRLLLLIWQSMGRYKKKKKKKKKKKEERIQF